jgi:hypothetical protein
MAETIVLPMMVLRACLLRLNLYALEVGVGMIITVYESFNVFI